MAAKSHSIKFPPDLYEVMSLRSRAAGYRSVAAYVKGLIRYDALVQGPHSVTLPWSNLPDTEQDRVDAQLLDVTRRGLGERGQLLERLIERATKSGGDVTGESISKRVPG